MAAAAELLLLPSRAFEPLVYGVGAWTDNLHFAYDLVATLKPRLLVELGTDRGESYFAFCQSAAENQIGTRCFAVDTWRGDHQAGGYDETTFAEVATHNRDRYAAFSTLLRCSFHEALTQFEPGTIDLLHIDGLHTEAAVRDDFESWLPKVRPGGIILLHDIGVRTGDFGVWKLWEELCRRGRSYAFTIGPGLGVWEKPPDTPLPQPLETLLGGPRDAAEGVATYYRSRAGALQEKIAQQWRDGTIRDTAAGRQTIVQIFHTHDGTHRDADSAVGRVGHGAWKEISIDLPLGAGAAPLRMDFLSAYTTIDVASITVTAGQSLLFDAASRETLSKVQVAGDADLLPHPEWLRVRITGIDPQLYLPALPAPEASAPLRVTLKLRVSTAEPLD